MNQPRNIFRIFIASPSDLAEERMALRDIMGRLHDAVLKETEWDAELLGWEDMLPGAGRPQALINADLDKADLFIGCVWQRWGTPSGSGTRTGFEEEFDRAIDRLTRTGTPEIWLFFKAVDPIARANPSEQLKKVLEFRERVIESKRLLFRDFDTLANWRVLISDFLYRKLLCLGRNPLGRGLRSSAIVESGRMQYLEVPRGLTAAENLTIHFDGGFLQRRSEGGIELNLRPSHSYPTMTAFQNLIAEVLTLATSSETLSSDPRYPTVFSGVIEKTISAGTLVPDPLQPNRAIPCAKSFAVHSRAVFQAFLDGSTLRGSLQAGLIGGPAIIRTEMELRLR